jgi:hypothetical protein
LDSGHERPDRVAAGCGAELNAELAVLGGVTERAGLGERYGDPPGEAVEDAVVGDYLGLLACVDVGAEDGAFAAQGGQPDHGSTLGMEMDFRGGGFADVIASLGKGQGQKGVLGLGGVGGRDRQGQGLRGEATSIDGGGDGWDGESAGLCGCDMIGDYEGLGNPAGHHGHFGPASCLGEPKTWDLGNGRRVRGTAILEPESEGGG